MNIPETTDLTVLEDIPLSDVIPLIDWKMYLVSWDFRTAEARDSEQAQELLGDSRRLLEKIENEKLLSVDGAVRIMASASSDFDNILVYETDKRDAVYRTLPMLRRQVPRLGFCPSLADFLTPAGSPVINRGIDDYMGFFAVTGGKKVEETLEIFDKDDLYSPLLLKSLADRLAEAGAEYIHRTVRRDIWAYAPEENLSVENILKEKYQGIRPAPGYPCCPDHSGKKDIFDILQVEKNIGISLTESYMMQPAASVCGYIFASEKAHYFPVGKIGQDQLESYAHRKGKSVTEIKRCLSVDVND